MNTTGLSSPSLSQVIADRTPVTGGRQAIPAPGEEMGRQGAEGQKGEGGAGHRADAERMVEAQEAINGVLEHLNVKLKLSVDRDLERVVAKIVDRETEEVIRQIPSEEMLEMAKHLQDMSGLLMDEHR
jgi:flagellar protein FlaG